MLYQESLWFKSKLTSLLLKGDLVLNIGSSTADFIEHQQPYIRTNLFDVIHQKEAQLLNVDIKAAPGVDLVGDVTDPGFIQKLLALQPRLIICSNLLEHISDRAVFCNALQHLVKGNTVLLVSVPYQFPYHPDPIDTGYRPTPQELLGAFPQLRVTDSQIVSGGLFLKFIHPNTGSLLIYFKLLMALGAMIIAKATRNKEKADRMVWSLKTISATCVAFQSDGR